MSLGVVAADSGQGGTKNSTATRLNGTWLALGLLLVSIVQSFSGLAHYVNYTFPAAALLVSLLLVSNRRTSDCLEFTLWLWVTAPGLRRIVDWASSDFNSSSPILATPALASLVIGLTALRGSRCTPFYFYFVFFVTLAGVYATLRGMAESGPLPAVVSAILWFAPIALGVTVLADRSNQLKYIAAVLRFSRWALLILSLYAIAQWAFAPAWDSFWLMNVTPDTDYFGRPEPFQIRVFSLCSASFVFAHVTVWLLLSQAGQAGSIIQRLGFISGCIALGLSEVRAAWISLALATTLLVCCRKIRLTPPLVTIGVGAYLIVVFAAPVADLIVERFSTFQTARADESLLTRVGLYEEILPQLLSDIYGTGMGSAGSGLRAGGVSNGISAEFASLDSSYLEILRTQGSLFGTATILLVVGASFAACRALALEAPYSSWAAIAVIIPFDMVFGNVTSGAAGVVSWVVLGASAWRRDTSSLGVSEPDMLRPTR